MANPGAKPNPLPSVRAIVAHGLTARQRRELAELDDGLIRRMRAAGYSSDTINDCILEAQRLAKGSRRG